VNCRGALLGPEESGRPGGFQVVLVFLGHLLYRLQPLRVLVGVVVWLGPAFTKLLVGMSGWGVFFPLCWVFPEGSGGLGLVFLPVF
jgi:hypothetical protein